MSSTHLVTTAIARIDIEVSMHRLKRLDLTIAQLETYTDRAPTEIAGNTHGLLVYIHQTISSMRRCKRASLQRLGAGVQQGTIDEMKSRDNAMEQGGRTVEDAYLAAYMQDAPSWSQGYRMLWTIAHTTLNAFWRELYLLNRSEADALGTGTTNSPCNSPRPGNRPTPTWPGQQQPGPWHTQANQNNGPKRSAFGADGKWNTETNHGYQSEDSGWGSPRSSGRGSPMHSVEDTEVYDVDTEMTDADTGEFVFSLNTRRRVRFQFCDPDEEELTM
jgi:hypothetical protein